MIEQQATVIRVSEDVAEVEVQRQTACGTCSAKGGCGTALLASLFSRARITLKLDNRLNAQSGDLVTLGLDENEIQRASVWMYAVPLAGLLLGAVLGERLFIFLRWSQELGSVSIGLLGLIAALIAVRLHTHAQGLRGRGGVRLIRIDRRELPTVPAVPLGDLAHPTQDFRKAR